MKDIFTVTLETEVAWFDDTRVHGTYGDLVNLFSIHREEISRSGNYCRRCAAARSVGSLKSNRLQPGMPFRLNLPLLGDLTFEPMSLRAF
jgi:hypothetical protein